MATTQELINYYANLLILQYVGKPKAYATIQATVAPVIMDQLPTQVQDAYNLIGSSPAVGVQLDVLGKYAGVTRNGTSFTGGPIRLGDADFLALIQFAVIQNNAGSSLNDIVSSLNKFFGDTILVFDYKNMHMSYLINSSVGSQDLIQVLVAEGLLPKPMGVGLGSVIYVPVIDAFFGMTEYELYELTGVIEPNASPFNTYTGYNTDWPWLSYTDSVSPFYTQPITTEDGIPLITEDGDGIIIQ